MIISNTFDTNTSSEWTIYNGGSRTVGNGSLIYTNNSTSQGVLLSPYNLTVNTSIEFDIKLTADYQSRQHGGCWLYDKDKNNWLRFYFLDGNIGVNQLKGQTPISDPLSWLNVYERSISPKFNSGKVFKMRLEVTGTTLKSYLDGALINERDIGFAPAGFALFAYGSQIAIDNLVINQQAYIISGKSLQDDSKASRFVLIHDWATGDFIKKVVPAADGSWSYTAPDSNPVLVTHVGADGFAPQADGGIIPVAS